MVLIFAVIIDQATKAAARKMLGSVPEPFLPGVMDLVHVENTGAAFSMGEGATALFVAVGVAVLVLATCLMWRGENLPMRLVVPIALVAGGGLGNLIDRVIRGSVTDFLATSFIDFPVFNVADICVTVGMVVGIIAYWTWDGTGSDAPDGRDGRDG